MSCVISNKFLQTDLKWKVFSPFAVMLQIELICIQFPLVILEMSLQLDWSPPVANPIDLDII